MDQRQGDWSLFAEIYSLPIGVSEEISTDGGPQFKSDEFKAFLKNWGVKHRQFSMDYPQSNG